MPVLYRYNGTTAAWEVVGAGSPTLPGYWPDLPPMTANANDDEFNTGSLGAAWTKWDFGGVGTVTVDNYGLHLVNSNTSGDVFFGIYRPIPTGDFSIAVKVYPQSRDGVVYRFGLALFEDATVSTGDFAMFGWHEGDNLTYTRWNQYNSWQTEAFWPKARYEGNYWRVRRIGTTYYWDVSLDGIDWKNVQNGPAGVMASAGAMASVNHIGFVLHNNNATPSTARVRFWRQTGSTAFDQPILGQVTPTTITGSNLLPLDVPPVTPHAKDDDFIGPSLDPKWTNPLTSATGQTNTITLGGTWLALGPSTGGSGSTGKHVFGIRQTSPTGSFTVSAKLRDAGYGSDIRSGIYVAVTGGKGHICGGFLQDSGPGVIGVTTVSNTADWSSYDTFVASKSLGASPLGGMQITWAQIKWNASTSTFTFNVSVDGAVWHLLTTRTGMTQPDQMGICIYSNGGTVGADSVITADWFRVTEP